MNLAEQFTQIMKEHENLIYKISTLYTFNANDREDLYQEIVFQLRKSFEFFNGDVSFLK